MRQTNKGNDSTAGFALALAAMLGVLADRLFPAGPEGAGFAIWLLLLGGAAVLVARHSDATSAGPAASGAVAGWSAVAAAAALAMVVRTTEVVLLAMWLVLFASASMVLLRAAGVRLWTTRPSDHVLGLALVPARAVAGAAPLLGDVQAQPDSSRRRVVAFARGALIAAPLLLIFGGLFSSADAGFNRYAVKAATFWSEDALTHLVFIVAFGWIAAGLLSGVRARRLPTPPAGFRTPRLGTEETAVVLGLLALLFLTFVGFQLGYLFGGREVIEATSGLTMAEYARRGFFELMVVGVATLGVLLAGDAVTMARRLFRRLAGVLIACVLVILASATQRLMLYTDTFGLTVDRITAAAVMAWVAVVLMLFAATVLRERPRPFSSGALIAGILTAFALVAVNPAHLAARSNLDRAEAGVREADVGYLARLGADAVPIALERIHELPPADRCDLAGRLLSGWAEGRDGTRADRDWRTWNASRAAAQRAVQASEAELAVVASGC